MVVLLFWTRLDDETPRICPLNAHAHSGSNSDAQLTSRTRKSTRRNTDDREQKGLRREPQKERNVPVVSPAVEKFGLSLLQKFLLLVFHTALVDGKTTRKDENRRQMFRRLFCLARGV